MIKEKSKVTAETQMTKLEKMYEIWLLQLLNDRDEYKLTDLDRQRLYHNMSDEQKARYYITIKKSNPTAKFVEVLTPEA
jgi:hypothetical protein